MLGSALSVLIAYLVSRHVRRLVVLVVVASTAATSLVANLMFLAYGTIASEELVGRVIGGTLLGTVIALVARYFLKGADSDAALSESDGSNASALDVFVAELAANPSDEAIRKNAQALFDAGYDLESLIDLVRERAGMDNAALVQQALMG